MRLFIGTMFFLQLFGLIMSLIGVAILDKKNKSLAFEIFAHMVLALWAGILLFGGK